MKTAPWASLFCCVMLLTAVGAVRAADDVPDTTQADAAVVPRIELPTTYEQSDTVFNKVSLSPTGVIGIDTLGNYWQYDFNAAVFIPYLPSDPSGSLPIEPVVDRCTERHPDKPFTLESVVEYNEYVEGSVIAFGRVLVKGWVQGSVQSINGRVIVESSGQVDGDIRAPEVEVRPGGVVSGLQTITQPYSLPLTFLTENALPIVLGGSLLVLFTTFLIVSLMPRQLTLLNLCIIKYRWRSFWVGLTSLAILMPLILAVMVVSVVGWVVVPLVPFVLYLAAALGIASAGYRLGLRVLAKVAARYRASMLLSLTGVAIVGIFWLVSVWMARSEGPVVSSVGVIVVSLLALLSTYPILTGIGASLLTRFGFRPYISLREAGHSLENPPAPAPPPVPEAPPVIAESSRLSELTSSIQDGNDIDPSAPQPLKAGEAIPDHIKPPPSHTASSD